MAKESNSGNIIQKREIEKRFPSFFCLTGSGSLVIIAFKIPVNEGEGVWIQ